MADETEPKPVRNPNGRTPQAKHLAPAWNADTAREAQLKSAAARSRNRQIREASIKTMRQLAELKLAVLPPKEELSALAVGVLTEVMLKIASGNIKPKTAHEAVALVKAMFEMHRVLEGQPTSITWTEKYASERLADLSDRAKRQKLGLVQPTSGA